MRNSNITTEIILKYFSGRDAALVRALARLQGGDDAAVLLAAALVSRAASDGHVCIDLSRWAGQPWATDDAIGPGFTCPPLDTWCRRLQASLLVGEPTQWRPLILDRGHFLYLQRFHHYEQMVAQHLRLWGQQEGEALLPATLAAHLGRFFPETDAAETDWQKVAAVIALRRRLCIISGPPGTGKTTTAARIIGLLIAVHDPQPLRFALCAPTGKAAARLAEALKRAAAVLPDLTTIRNRFPIQTSTIHRLLGYQRQQFVFNAANPLPADVVVVDEASMVDLALMAHLVAAVPPDARLIILGDHHQLASVEAGAVLGNICQDTVPTLQSPDLQVACGRLLVRTPSAPPRSPLARSPLSDNVVVLTRNFRFDKAQGIGALVQAVNGGNLQVVRELLARSGDALQWLCPPLDTAAHRRLEQTVVDGYRPLFAADAPDQALAALEGFMVLGALTGGPWGTHRLNRWIETLLRQSGLITGPRQWYAGRPVMIRRNDYRTGLFNGDVGVAWPDHGRGGGDPRVWFRFPTGELRSFTPAQLPEHQTALALTVHKSQGSEYRCIVLVLPDQDSPVLCRELVYTGLSRARQRIVLVSNDHVLGVAINRPLMRASGLRIALENPFGPAGGKANVEGAQA
jgi:exodeoxyribonuclease V alpha subunit